MSSANTKPTPVTLDTGITAQHISPLNQLRRTVMSTLLWEDQFYEDGKSIAKRITELVYAIDAPSVLNIAVEAREKMHLRHIPLLLAKEMAAIPTHKTFVAEVLEKVIQRPDELAEFVALYWGEKKKPLSAQVKKGLAKAFTKFNAFSLAKYNRLDKKVKLRDVLFLCHAKPKNDVQAQDWKNLINNTLQTPDTWEVSLSKGEKEKTKEDKKEVWTRMLTEKKLGGLALLRNLRNFQEADVDRDLIKTSILNMKTDRILPFRFISAAKYAPTMESELGAAMMKCLADAEKMKGKTCILIDVSGSMNSAVSSKSDLLRTDAACALAILLREICEDLEIFTFSDNLVQVPNRHGFALKDAILTSQDHSSTCLGAALIKLSRKTFDRFIVITDEQSTDKVTQPTWSNKYMINVASSKNGIGYHGWTHIDGFSEQIVNYIQEYEKFKLFTE